MIGSGDLPVAGEGDEEEGGERVREPEEEELICKGSMGYQDDASKEGSGKGKEQSPEIAQRPACSPLAGLSILFPLFAVVPDAHPMTAASEDRKETLLHPSPPPTHLMAGTDDVETPVAIGGMEPRPGKEAIARGLSKIFGWRSNGPMRSVILDWGSLRSRGSSSIRKPGFVFEIANPIILSPRRQKVDSDPLLLLPATALNGGSGGKSVPVMASGDGGLGTSGADERLHFEMSGRIEDGVVGRPGQSSRCRKAPRWIPLCLQVIRLYSAHVGAGYAFAFCVRICSDCRAVLDRRICPTLRLDAFVAADYFGHRSRRRFTGCRRGRGRACCGSSDPVSVYVPLIIHSKIGHWAVLHFLRLGCQEPMKHLRSQSNLQTADWDYRMVRRTKSEFPRVASVAAGMKSADDSTEAG
ncbi:hypothetical protein KC357_g230 [Hortaea werneckii]|nr:hypothetical protein KC357_g230 [Hortaea werneckii]